MQLKTILNHVSDYKSFVIGKVSWQDEELKSTLEIEVKPRANGRRICSGCQQVRPGYDTSTQVRRFDFVPLWGIAVCLVYQMRRVNCPDCGIKVEQVPWADGKSRTTKEYKCFLAKWARRMSWKEVAVAFSVSWECVFESVKWAVSWGLAHRQLENIETLGVDEVQWSRGHKYQTVVYQIDKHCKRLLWVGPDRKSDTLDKQTVKLKELLQYNLQSVRSHIMKEDFQRFWKYSSSTWASKFLDAWCTRAMRSRIDPMKKLARTLRDKRALILNWFQAEGTVFIGYRRGFQQQTKTDHQKIVRLSNPKRIRNRVISQPC